MLEGSIDNFPLFRCPLRPLVLWCYRSWWFLFWRLARARWNTTDHGHCQKGAVALVKLHVHPHGAEDDFSSHHGRQGDAVHSCLTWMCLNPVLKLLSPMLEYCDLSIEPVEKDRMALGWEGVVRRIVATDRAIR